MPSVYNRAESLADLTGATELGWHSEMSLTEAKKKKIPGSLYPYTNQSLDVKPWGKGIILVKSALSGGG